MFTYREELAFMCPYQEKLTFNRRIFGMCMKLKIIFLGVFLTASALTVKAQKSDSVTREEMTKYVVMMDSVESWKKIMAETNIKLAQGNKKITAARYTQLLPLLYDEKKLSEAKATVDEIAYLKKAMEIRNENARNFQNAFTFLMANVGEGTYKKVSKAVASDPKVKERYIYEINKLNGNKEASQ